MIIYKEHPLKQINMAPDKIKFITIEDYMSTLPKNSQSVLEEIRKAIKETAPDAEEVISYQLPAFKYHGMLIYYSAYKDHVSLSFPSATIFKAFEKELAAYETGKSTIKFPLNKPIPLKLVKDIVKHRMKENMNRKG
jgi:uncharacterized protein YdhG (YjbR/CyaY superfamily)